MVRRAFRAGFRAFLIGLLVTIPSLILPVTGFETAQVMLLLALAAVVFTFVEYFAGAPSFVEFRAAPPFNRIRFVALFSMVLLLTLILRGKTDPTTLTRLLDYGAGQLGRLLDFPYSPVRLAVLMLPQGADPALLETVRLSAAICYLIAVIAMLHFLIVIRVTGWPVRSHGFNIWVNLPSFDPNSTPDVAARLGRDGQINLALGFLLSFIIPAVVKLSYELGQPLALTSPHTLIWIISAWAFLPLSLMMRGIALIRITQLVVSQRKRLTGEGAARMHTA